MICQIGSEAFMMQVVALPGSALKQLGGAISDALRDICIEDRPTTGAQLTYERVPRAIPKLRAQLLARATSDDEAASTCSRLLQTIDEWREGYGDPMDEDRHPDISLGKPWPLITQSAWDAAVQFRFI